METTYYDVLGVTSDATLDDIKTNYKKLARQWHPDKNKNAEASERFKAIAAAYDILKDESKRRDYDASLVATVTTDFSRTALASMGRRGLDLKTVIEVTLEEIYSGTTVSHELERCNICTKCDGDGVRRKHKHGDSAETKKCRHCDGEGGSKETVIIHGIEIPRGIDPSHPIKLRGHGHQIPKKLRKSHDDEQDTRSTIIIGVIDKPHAIFKRGVALPSLNRVRECDLLLIINDITFVESVIGFTRTIQHLDGSSLVINFTHPIRHGDYYVIERRGLPKYKRVRDDDDDDDDTTFGDLFVKLEVARPTLTQDELTAFAQLFNQSVPEPCDNAVTLTDCDAYIERVASDTESISTADSTKETCVVS